MKINIPRKIMGNKYSRDMVVLITGGNSGIGLAIAKKFIGTGALTLIHVNRSKVPDEIKDKKNAVILNADFSNLKETEILIKQAISMKGHIDILVNCAGVSENKDFLRLNYDDILEIYNINVFSHFLLNQKIFQEMKERRFGRIVTISSIGVKYAGSEKSLIYSSSKAALEAMTRSFAKQGAKYNILANNVRAGVTDTKFHRGNQDKMKDRIEKIPLGRMCRPEEIADMVFYLCGESGSFITGQDISVSGGE